MVELDDKQKKAFEDESGDNYVIGKYLLVAVKKGDNPRDIEFSVPGGAVVPDDYLKLQTKIEHTATVLSILFPGEDIWSKERFGFYFKRLKNLAFLSLGQDQVALGEMALDTFQNDVLMRESGRVKNAYVVKLGRWAALFGVAFFGAYLLSLAPSVSKAIEDKTFFLMLLGSMLGTWLSFSIRKPTLSFDELATVEKDLLEPQVRLLFVAGLTVVVALILATGMVVVTIGGFKTTFLVSQAVGGDFNAGMAAMRALLIGCFCGIGEQLLPEVVGRRANAFVGALGAGTASLDAAPSPSRVVPKAPDSASPTATTEPAAGEAAKDHRAEPPGETKTKPAKPDGSERAKEIPSADGSTSR